MGLYKERVFRPRDVTPTVVNDVTVLATAQTTSTFTMTPTRVDTATAGSATGNITADANDTTMATNIQTAIRALGGIYADATVAAGTTDTWIITVFGGYDITWATTATGPTITESGSAGGTTAVPGSCTYAGSIPIGRFAQVKKLNLKGFNDNSLDVSIKDATSGTQKNVFVATGIDTSTASADTPYVKLLTADGVAGEDGAAAANVSSGLFFGPLTVSVVTSAPAAARSLTPTVALTCQMDGFGGKVLQRSTGALAALSGTLNLGEMFGNIKRIKLVASADTTVAPTVTDADGLVVYTKSSTDYTGANAVDAQLSHEGVDQANNAVADLLDVVAKSPLTISGSGLGSGTFTITVWVEI